MRHCVKHIACGHVKHSACGHVPVDFLPSYLSLGITSELAIRNVENSFSVKEVSLASSGAVVLLAHMSYLHIPCHEPRALMRLIYFVSTSIVQMRIGETIPDAHCRQRHRVRRSHSIAAITVLRRETEACVHCALKL